MTSKVPHIGAAELEKGFREGRGVIVLMPGMSDEVVEALIKTALKWCQGAPVSVFNKRVERLEPTEIAP